MAEVTPPSTATEALAMLQTAMGYLVDADAGQLATETQAHALQVLERLDAVETAARASILGAFATGQGHLDDADHSPRSWLEHKTRITRSAAASHVAWTRRAIAHPLVVQALAAGEVSQSFARDICLWNDKLPAECREMADEILLAAAKAGADRRDLARLAAEIYERSMPDPDPDPGLAFEDRSVRLETTFDGAGVMVGDLTPKCAAVVRTVLDALSAPRDGEDTRTHAQRYHDALQEAMTRLVAAGMVPERAGQPSKVLAHISLKDLIDLDAGSELTWQWAARLREQWAGHRAADAVIPGDGGAWLDGEDAAGFACDASVTPVVFGEVDPSGLDELLRLCLQMTGHGPFCRDTSTGEGEPPAAAAGVGPEDLQPPVPAEPAADRRPAAPAAPAPAGPAPALPAEVVGPRSATSRGRAALAMAIIGKAATLMSGPGGLASFLRRHEFDGKLAGPSLPLDVGVSRDIPAGIRAAVIARDKHCQWPGGYFLYAHTNRMG